jgi:hypothetical protein
MKSFDSQDDLTANTVPELIKHLWELYMSMSLDPALAPCAVYIRQAALVLETTRRMAHEVAVEARPRRSKGAKRRNKSDSELQSELEWLGDGRPTSPTKH